LARERGQTSSEYITLIVVVAAAILAVSFTDVGEAIRSQDDRGNVERVVNPEGASRRLSRNRRPGLPDAVTNLFG